MEKSELYFQYVMWLVVFLCVKFLFDYISKKTSNLGKLLLGTILPTWLIITIITYINGTLIGDRVTPFFLYSAETLAMTLLIGGITFIYKYKKFKNKYKAK